MKIAIVGGGAAGFFAAIRVAEQNPKAKVVILEASKQLLAKVRVSGGGRCNVTHNCFEISQFINAYPRGSRELRSAFSRFQAKDTVNWFQSRGVKLKTESDGRMFPVTDNSETIINCLQAAAKNSGVEIVTNAKVQAISPQDSPAGRIYKLQIKSPVLKEISAARVLLATGGTKSAFTIAESLGHSIVDPVPSLFTFELEDSRIKGLSGVSVVRAELALTCQGKVFKEHGPLLITHWGLSGPAVLKLSAHAARELFLSDYHAELEINWLGIKPENIYRTLQTARNEKAKVSVKNHIPIPLPQRIWLSFLTNLEIAENTKWADLSNKLLTALRDQLCTGKYQICGKGVFKEEFVTCGGVALNEVDFRTMESKLARGVFFAGEILDIDAITGGYNFQAAWTTGWIAGENLAKTVTVAVSRSLY